MNQGDCSGDILIVGAAVDCAVAEVSYLQCFLWGRLICDGVAEIIMMGEC
jgi:hypothetical protein